MKWLPALIVVLVLAGCKSEEPAPMTTPAKTDASTPAQTRNESGPTPIGSGMAGGMTPMTGTESVEGSGSGVGSAAKDMARNAAGSASSSSAAQVPADGE